LGCIREIKTIPWNNFNDILEASAYVGQQEDASGLIIIQNFWYDGGYTFLHRNISIIHLDNPGINETLHWQLKNPSIYNYVIVPHYKYLFYPFLQQNLIDTGWILKKTILDRTDVWFRQ
jgi:hypothetical protein